MKKHPALSAALSTDTGTPLSAEQIRIRDLVCSTDHSALLQRLLSPGVSKALYSRAVIDFVIEYGKATDAHLPIVRSAGEKAYDEKIAQGFSVEDAEQAAYTARLNEYLKVPFPPFPRGGAPSSGASKALCTPPSQEDSDPPLLSAEEQPK
ncbi:hypothetical protein HZF02_23190 [Pseudomonas yamanorum]|nr:hypothetical protein HZF02_23190 [Pseudomonas yamanorum]